MSAIPICRITAGDLLRISCGDDTLTRCVTGVEEYESFEAMLDAEAPAAIGGPDMTHDQLVTAICNIHPPEKEALDAGAFALPRRVRICMLSRLLEPGRLSTPSNRT
ncbi:hypothetical protein [Streptomyces luteireticuli]|uniref:hypothetical protein n=1 Tax=Streptomyces luteireticuli TaxID=173858 RepID=UPI003556719C